MLQAATAAIKQYHENPNVTQSNGTEDLKVWGYRNVWFTFNSFEINKIIPVSLLTMANSDHMFLNSFESQRDAQFPSPEIEGPFCKMARKVQCEYFEVIRTCLGRDWFWNHPSPHIRATRGLVFLKEMTVHEALGERFWGNNGYVFSGPFCLKLR